MRPASGEHRGRGPHARRTSRGSRRHRGRRRAQRLHACLDSCHLASGYDIRTAEGLSNVVDAFDRVVGLDRLGSLHVNDSKTALGSNVDRTRHSARASWGSRAARPSCRSRGSTGRLRLRRSRHGGQGRRAGRHRDRLADARRGAERAWLRSAVLGPTRVEAVLASPGSLPQLGTRSRAGIRRSGSAQLAADDPEVLSLAELDGRAGRTVIGDGRGGAGARPPCRCCRASDAGSGRAWSRSAQERLRGCVLRVTAGGVLMICVTGFWEAAATPATWSIAAWRGMLEPRRGQRRSVAAGRGGGGARPGGGEERASGSYVHFAAVEDHEIHEIPLDGELCAFRCGWSHETHVCNPDGSKVDLWSRDNRDARTCRAAPLPAAVEVD